MSGQLQGDGAADCNPDHMPDLDRMLCELERLHNERDELRAAEGFLYGACFSSLIWAIIWWGTL